MEPLLDQPRPPAARRARVRLGLAAALALACGALTGAFAQASGYFIQADTVRGAVGAQGAVCVINSVFMQGEQVVFRAYVYDAATGEQLTQEEIDARGVKVYGVIDGERVVELEYVPHPPESEQTEFFWARGYQLPADHPTGNFTWSVEVEDAAGTTAAYQPPGHTVGLGALTILPPGGAPAAPGAPGEGAPPPGGSPEAPGAPETPGASAAPGGGGGG